MIKMIITLIFLAALALGGYCIYRGLTGENNNAGMIAMDAGNLAESVTNTFKDGATDFAKDLRNKATKAAAEAKDSAKQIGNRAIDSVKAKTDTVVNSVKEDAAEAVSSVSKSVAGSDK